MKNPFLTSIVTLLVALAISATASAQIRVLSYNIAEFRGDSNAIANVLNAASDDDSHGFASPVSIMLFQEVNDSELDLLQSVVGSGYTLATFTDQNDSSWGGAQAMFYLSSQFVENTALHEDIFTGAGRHADRWALNVNGYAGKRLYVYSMHLKASTGTANQETRRAGVESVRDDIMTLPSGSHVIAVGDMNFYSPNEPAYDWFIASGDGQLVDPLGNNVSWSGADNALKHTQSPLSSSSGGLIGGGLDDRFDFQFLSSTLLDGGGFDLISSTYRSLGNDGNHYNDAINDGNNTYYPGDTPRGNQLADDLIIASDHLPLIADYQLPAILGWNWDPGNSRVLVGAESSVEFEIQNNAPVTHPLGADVLDVNVIADGDLSGKESISVPALSSPQFVSFFLDTTEIGSWNSVITLTSLSEETQTTPEIVKVSGDVIAHANASFSFSQDLDWYIHDVSFEQNTGVQEFNLFLFNYGYDGTQSLLEVDSVSAPSLPLVFEGISTIEVGSIPSLITFSIDTDNVEPDTYISPMPIEVSDEDIPGEQSGISMLTVRVEITTPASCAEDFDGNGEVAIADLLVLIGDWGGDDPIHDLDGNGIVGVSDILLLIAAWGPC